MRARQAQLADLSAVALLKRLRKSKDWLHALCVEPFRQQGFALTAAGGFQIRTFDSQTVQEPGRTGSLWHLDYSVRLPSLTCDHFRLTPTEGCATGASLARFPIAAGDYVLADRGYATVAGLRHVAASAGYATVRVDTSALPLETASGQPFDWLAAVRSLPRALAVGEWRAQAAAADRAPIPGRICALRKSAAATRIAVDKLRREASRNGKQVQPCMLECAGYVILFTTFPEATFSGTAVHEQYRLRWQVEPVILRFKPLAELGHLPKYDDESAKAWLYGKLLVALLVEQLIHHACAISPWGYPLAQPACI